MTPRRRTTLTRWLLAVPVFLLIGWVNTAYGHRWGLALLVAAILVVFFFGGQGGHGRSGDPGAGEPP